MLSDVQSGKGNDASIPDQTEKLYSVDPCDTAVSNEKFVVSSGASSRIFLFLEYFRCSLECDINMRLAFSNLL